MEARRAGDRVEIAVSDTGIGIDPEMLTRIIEMLTQIDSALDRVTGGMGIGLALVRTLVELHGGTVEARSEGPGQGSTFVVQLPAADSSKLPVSRPVRPPGQSAVHRNRRVLLVDDNEDAAHALARLLTAFGHEIRIFHSGQEAITAAPEFRPEAVLLDIGLPDLNGYQFARRLRDNPDLDPFLLVAVSGYGQERQPPPDPRGRL